jgi:hypothetical protein
LKIGFVLCIVAGLAFLGPTALSRVGAVNGSATPTASRSASPSPNGSTIHIFFSGDEDGSTPGFAELSEPITRLLADGVDCTPSHSHQPVSISQYVITWPRAGDGLPAECSKGPPTSLHFEFSQRFYPTSPILVDVTWHGDDLDVLVPLLAEAAGTPTATPVISQVTASPGSLPSAGGPPVGREVSTDVALVSLLGALALLFAAMSARYSRRN